MSRRSLVTGAHGFVGSHLARALVVRGDRVTVIDKARPQTGRSGLELQGIAGEVELITADLARPGAVPGRGFDSVFHLAAQTLVGPAMSDPVATFESNITATWQLLEVCRAAQVPRVVVASSDKAYGSSNQLPYREDQRLNPGSPYEASKAATDLIAHSYFHAYGLPVAVSRFANIYGGGDLNFSRLIPEAVAAVAQGRRPVIRSDGSPQRDFLYVDDAVAAYLSLEGAIGQESVAGRAFNAGGGRPYSVRELLDQLAEALGREIDPDYRGQGNPEGEIDRQFVDSTRLTELTGWAPAMELTEGLRRTYEWYAANAELLA